MISIHFETYLTTKNLLRLKYLLISVIDTIKQSQEIRHGGYFEARFRQEEFGQRDVQRMKRFSDN